jgi:hypothetical protein
MDEPLDIGDLTWLRPDWRDALVESVHRLERLLEGVRDRGFRRTVVCDAIRDLDPEPLVATLVLLHDRGRQGQHRARAVLAELALEPVVFDEMPYTRVAAAYALAHAHGHDAVARMFTSTVERNNPTVDEAFTENEHLEAPLGVRRAAARQQDRFMLDRLVHDRDWRVIAALLDNPRMVERDVVKIAAMRPTRAAVLEVVARHGRWSSRYRVRKALCFNPYTPAPIARRLVPTLLRTDLHDLIGLGRLPDDLRDHARALLDARPEDDGVDGPYRATVDLSADDLATAGDLTTLLDELGANYQE